MDTTEKKEPLQPALQILKETAEKFRSLEQEAKIALMEKKDIDLYEQKLEERAQLLINLPNLLSNKLKGVNFEIEKGMMMDIIGFAAIAQKVMEMEKKSGLGVPLLTHMGDKINDKNDLEKLIASLESTLESK